MSQTHTATFIGDPLPAGISRHRVLPPEALFSYVAALVPSFDSLTNVFFERELAQILPEIIVQPYVGVTIRELFPVNVNFDPLAETVIYRQFDHAGVAKIISEYGDDEIPVVSLSGKEYVGHIRTIAAAAKWSIFDIQRAAKIGRDGFLRDLFDSVVIDKIRREENRIGWEGDENHQLQGLLDNPNIPIDAVPNGASGFPEWSTKTGPETLSDLLTFTNKIAETTNDIEAPDTLVLSTERRNLLVEKDAEDGTGRSVLEVFLSRSPYIRRVGVAHELRTAGPGATQMAVAYRFDRNVAELRVAQDVSQRAPKEKDMHIVVDYFERFGGLVVRRPLAFQMFYGF